MAKQKFYVVWEGKRPGIYESWAACKQQVEGYPDARYKSFPTKREAVLAYKEGPFSTSSEPKKKSGTSRSENIILPSLSVDAACSGNPGLMEYQGVNTETGERIFHLGPLEQGTNNIGEFLALVHALALLQKRESQLPIYTDSRTAMAWVRNKKAKTSLKLTKRNAYIFELIQRAENWLKNNTYSNPILKWDTENWGEIPADFGRK